jgi:hypothetical protein
MKKTRVIRCIIVHFFGVRFIENFPRVDIRFEWQRQCRQFAGLGFLNKLGNPLALPGNA